MGRDLQTNSQPGFQIPLVPPLGGIPGEEVSRTRNTRATSILLADHHAMFRDGLHMLLEGRAGFRVVGQAGDGEEAVRLVQELKPDVLLLELAMPRLGGLDVLRELAHSSAPVRRIILTAALEPTDLVRAVQFGAQGMVLKRSASQVLFDCINAVMAGRYWVESENVSDLMQALRKLLTTPAAKSRARAFGLTARELEIIRAVVGGYANKEIAQRFSISEHTVKNHLTNIFDKLGVSNRLELALLGIEHRLTDLS